jgi:hypothetical protein
MGPNSDFKHWKRNFLNFLSLKAAYLIPQLAIRESGAWLDEQAHHYAYTLMMHAVSDYKRADQAMKCVSAACPDCATDIMWALHPAGTSSRDIMWVLPVASPSLSLRRPRLTPPVLRFRLHRLRQGARQVRS